MCTYICFTPASTIGKCLTQIASLRRGFFLKLWVLLSNISLHSECSVFSAYFLLFFFHYAAMGELIFLHWLGEESPFLGPKWLLGAIWMSWCGLYSAIRFRAHWLQWKVWLHILLLLSRELYQGFSLKSVFWSLSPLRGRRTKKSLKKCKSQKKMVRKAETLARIDDGRGHRRDWVFLLWGTPQIPAS